MKNLTKFLILTQSKILVGRFLTLGVKNLSKFDQTTQSLAKFWLRPGQIFGQVEGWTVQIFRFGRSNRIFWPGFHPQRVRKFSDFDKFLSKSGQKFPINSEIFVVLLEIFLMEISKRTLKIWNFFQILSRNSVRIPLISQIHLWRIWEIRENFKYWNFLKISQANFLEIPKSWRFWYLPRNFTNLILWNFCKAVNLTALPKIFSEFLWENFCILKSFDLLRNFWEKNFTLWNFSKTRNHSSFHKIYQIFDKFCIILIRYSRKYLIKIIIKNSYGEFLICRFSLKIDIENENLFRFSFS